MSDSEPIVFRPRGAASPEGISANGTSGASAPASSGRREPSVTVFDRRELGDIFAVYGRKVAAGEWRDYALDFRPDKAVFSVYRRTSEWPLYRIEKNPRNARKQGAYSVITATGLILKRGHELKRVLEVLEKRSFYVVES
ncbi:MAG: DUF2794 domain-containing protein [Hyphomicrobiaceae bacterium]